jgi:hypothetical protein
MFFLVTLSSFKQVVRIFCLFLQKFHFGGTENIGSLQEFLGCASKSLLSRAGSGRGTLILDQRRVPWRCPGKLHTPGEEW